MTNHPCLCVCVCAGSKPHGAAAAAAAAAATDGPAADATGTSMMTTALAVTGEITTTIATPGVLLLLLHQGAAASRMCCSLRLLSLILRLLACGMTQLPCVIATWVVVQRKCNITGCGSAPTVFSMHSEPGNHA